MANFMPCDFREDDASSSHLPDSFIVPFEEEDRLLQLMKKAFEHVTYQSGIKAKFNNNLTKKQLYAHGAQDRNWFLDMVFFVNKGSPSKGYLKRLKRHREHYGL